MKHLVLLLMAVFVFGLSSFAQSKEELQKLRTETKKELEYSNNLLEQTKKKRQKSVQELLITNKRIELRQNNINTLSKEISGIESKIAEIQLNIIHLKKQIAAYKSDYAQMIVQYYKIRENNNKLMYILASNDFNQAYYRLKYLQKFSDYRKEQIQEINASSLVLENTVAEYESLKYEKQNLLNGIVDEHKVLDKEKKAQKLLLDDLSKKEKELRKEIERKKKRDNELKRKIEKIIAEEIKKSRKASGTEFSLTPEEKLLNDQFASNQNRLPWPVERGIITDRFGEHFHPVIKGVKVRNDGIDISTNGKSKVRCVFNGVVTNVFVIPGINKVVIVRHGNYLSVYSNLIDVFVKAGQLVDTKEEIGVLATDESSNISVLKFQIWKENQKLNPELWLSQVK